MKLKSALMSFFAFGTIVRAELNDPFSNAMSLSPATQTLDEMTLVASNTEDGTAGTQQAQVEQPLFGKETTTWNFNLGMSNFDNTSDRQEGFKGKGLSFEVQKRFLDILYGGFTYTNYTVMDMTTVSLEGHIIRLQMPGRSEFFGAVNAGVMAPFNTNRSEGNIVSPNYFFGAGVGINISNQIGLRADVKSTPEVRAYNSISLVGYY